MHPVVTVSGRMCEAALTPGDRASLTIPRFSSAPPRTSSANLLQTLFSFYNSSNRVRKMSQYTSNDSTNFSHNTNSFNVWNSYTVADDWSRLLAWLSPLDPSLRHCDIQERRVRDIGGRLLQTVEFRRWCCFSGEGEGDRAVLFCYGDPGAGKTFIR